MSSKKNLNHHEMLQAEYGYIANTAFQANEDRARVTSFYFVSVGSLVAAILGTQFGNTPSPGASLAFFFLFATLTVMGGLTIAQLARLRAAWHESVEAMNTIKDFYIKDNPEIKPAFKWLASSVPVMNKPYSIANLIAIEVAMLGALTAGAGVYFLMNFFEVASWASLSLALIGFVAGFTAQWEWYKYLLVDDK